MQICVDIARELRQSCPPSVSVTAVSGLSGLVRANACFCDKLEFARIKTRLICMHNCTTPSFLPRSFRTRIET